MNEDNPPRKKQWESLKPRSDLHSAEDSGRKAASQDPSSLSSSRDGSSGRSSGSVRKLFGKVTKRFARSARQSPNPEPTQANKGLTAPTSEADREQSSDSGIVEASSTNEAEHLDPKVVNERIANATTKDVAGIGQVPTIVKDASSAINNIPSVPDTIDTFSALLKPLKAFNTIANEIANVHPYAKVALSIFTCASKMILDQADRDVAVSNLLSKISEVYTFIAEEEELAKIQSMLAIYGKIAQQTLECADFISHYSETKNAWIRLGKHVFNETDKTVQSYNNVLDSLMQQFRDQAARDTVVIVHRMAEILDLAGMEYATGAGLNTFKCCLPNTRRDLLKDIQNWISSTEGAPRVLWLSGTAGKGKSAVAHTIANWYIENGGLGSCFCFDRTRQADRRQDKIFTTIARELADCNPIMRRALAQAVRDHDGIKRTPDITKQWQELIVGPTNMISNTITAPVLIVIDALDESGEANSREQILRLLAGKLNTSTSQPCKLPANFRILLTSRPLEDIHNTLDAAPHVRHVSLDDISSASTELDIQRYISHKLEGLHHVFDNAHFKALALKSDGLFEWARLTCEYIKGTNRVGMDPKGRFDAVVSGRSAKGTRLLDDMYQRVLADIMPEDEREEGIPIFRSVMGQILVSLEPLPMPALTSMRLHFPEGTCDYNVDRVVGPLGSLLMGTSDSHTPIRPLHASFYDFLTDKSRSHSFFIDTSSVQSDLAFASLRVMKDELRFNICSLENSYLPNSSVPDLETRVKDSISRQLSYSCRFWGMHVAATPIESSLANEVEAFFEGERLLWWLEALALTKNLGGSIVTLSSIAKWVSGHAEFTHVSDATRDTLRFVRTFAATILRSTPHLYLSALPFAPTQSRMFRKFASKFPRTSHIVAGHVENWPQMEKILCASDIVLSVALSPDGKRIACGLGSFRGLIQVWDMNTGEALYPPLQGHTRSVASVAFSPDGHRIVSGSWDATIRVWDAKTGEVLGSPLQGHTSFVVSVAISPDGKRIVSGSWDKTIRVWDMEAGKAFGAPLQGHRGRVLSVAISPDRKCIVSGSEDRTLRVWDMMTGEALGASLQGHVGSVESVAISPDGKCIVSGSEDKTIRLWDMQTGKAIGTPLKGHTHSVTSVAILSDGNCIVSGSNDQTIRAWDAKTGEAVGSPLQGHTSSVRSVKVSPDGSHIVSGSFDKTIRVWDADTIRKSLVAARERHTGSVNSVAISPDGCYIVSGSTDTTVRVWDIETGKALIAPLQGHTDSIMSVVASSDGKGIVSGSADIILMWDVETGKASGVFEGHAGFVQCIAISPDRNHIVSGSYYTVHVWHMQTGKTYSLDGHSSWVQSVAISSDGSRIVSGSSDMTIQVWDSMEAGRALRARLQGHTGSVTSVAISQDVCRIVSGSTDKTIRVWNMGTGKQVGAPLQGHTGDVHTIAISSDGSRIVSGSTDRTIRVWDMKTGGAVATIRGHAGSVLSVAISPDGKRIVSGSNDKTIRVWDLEFLIRPHQSFEASTICFSSDLTHALHSASSFLQNSKSKTPAPPPSSSCESETSTSYAPNEEGWVVGPQGRLLLWTPLNLHPAVYALGNTLVIANDVLHLNLSRAAHGTSWHKCREQ